MRAWRPILLVTLGLSAAWASPAAADAPPSPDPAVPSTDPAVPSPAPAVPSLPAPALHSPPTTATLDIGIPRATVASLGPLGPLSIPARIGSSGESRPMRTVGAVIAGLGGGAFFAAGITAILAASSAADLESECPGRLCVEGTRGGDLYHRARDTAVATDWLVGIGAPVLTSGIVLLMYSAVLERRTGSLSPRPGPRAASLPPPVLRAGPTGASLTLHF